VQVDFDAAAALRDGGKLGFPETVLPSRNPALVVNAEGDSGNGWNLAKQNRQSVTAISSVGVIGEPL